MAKTKKERLYQHMEKVIITREQVARIGYVVADHKGNTCFFFEKRFNVRIAFNLEDAQEHCYKVVSGDYVMSYREEVWQAFQQIDARRVELGTWFEQIRRGGKIPQELIQPTLFAVENARPIGRE